MKPVSSILFSLYKGTLHHDEWVVACLQGAWSGLLGDRIAQACVPVALNDRKLVVQVRDPGWLPTLSSMSSVLLERIRSATGAAVAGIVFMPSSGA